MTTHGVVLLLAEAFSLPLIGCAGQEAVGQSAGRSSASEVYRYGGTCDASAAVPLDGTTFLVADDERNTLGVYRADRPGQPAQIFPWDAPLGIDPHTDEHPEADLEGAAVLAGEVYWIASHGRNRNGRWRPNRHRFFAITIAPGNDGHLARPFGKPYRNLILDLVADPKMRGLGLAEALQPEDKKVQRLAPKDQGLNVEGLCAAADGRSLLIAFRNPRPGGKALLVPLLNPAAVVGQGARPQFGPPIRLALHVDYRGERLSLGIRSIEHSNGQAAYLIAAGPHDTGKPFALYRWSGNQHDRPVLLPKSTAAIHRVRDFSPEALVLYPGRDRFQVLSDDGALPVRVASPADCKPGTFQDGWCRAKDLNDNRRKTFKSLWLDPE